MIMTSAFNTPQHEWVTWPKQILIGSDSVESIVPRLDKHFILIVDKSISQKGCSELPLLEIESACGTSFTCEREPHCSDILAIAQALGNRKPNILAVGGGATIDLAKGVMAQLHHGEIYCRDRLFRSDEVKFIAVPSTAGSGSEVSRFAVINNDQGIKQTSRSWDLRPDLTVLDSAMLQAVPAFTLLTWAFDAFNHLLEASMNHQEKTLCLLPLIRHGLKHIIHAVQYWKRTQSELLPVEVIRNLQLASTYGGIVISNVRTNLLHSFAEAYAPESPLSHPQTLLLFYKTVYRTLKKPLEAALQQIDLNEPVIANSEDVIEFWQFLFAHHYLALKGAVSNNKDLELSMKRTVNRVLNDRVLIENESPVPIEAKKIESLLVRAFDELLVQHESIAS